MHGVNTPGALSCSRAATLQPPVTSKESDCISHAHAGLVQAMVTACSARACSSAAHAIPAGQDVVRPGQESHSPACCCISACICMRCCRAVETGTHPAIYQATAPSSALHITAVCRSHALSQVVAPAHIAAALQAHLGAHLAGSRVKLHEADALQLSRLAV